MKNIFKIIVGLLVIAILGLLLYFTLGKVSEEGIAPVVVTQDEVIGCYVARLAKDVYTLNIESENSGVVSGMLAFNNFEKDSSSGPFVGTYKDGILLGEYSFDSEGMHSEMQVVFKKVGDTFVRGYGIATTDEDGKSIFQDLDAITYDPSSTFVKNQNCLEEFTEIDGKFVFDYNPFYKAYQSNNTLSTEWKLNAKQKGVLLARISIPNSYMSNTNFSSAYLTIGASTDPKEINACTIATSNDEVKGDNKTINGYPFFKFVSSDAGAGNFYETTSYRGLLDGDCYAIEYTIHSTNINNYSVDQNIVEFDKAKIQNEFEKIIASFEFLVNSD